MRAKIKKPAAEESPLSPQDVNVMLAFARMEIQKTAKWWKDAMDRIPADHRGKEALIRKLTAMSVRRTLALIEEAARNMGIKLNPRGKVLKQWTVIEVITTFDRAKHDIVGLANDWANSVKWIEKARANRTWGSRIDQIWGGWSNEIIHTLESIAQAIEWPSPMKYSRPL